VKGRAKFDFTGKEELKQLSFRKGDLVVISQQYDNGWWAGELNGKIGYVPATYIEIVPDGPGPDRSSTPPTRPQPNAPAGGVARPANPAPGSRPQGGGPPNGNLSGSSRPGGAAPPPVAGRPPTGKNPPPVAGRPPTGGGGGNRPQPMIAEEDDMEEDFIPAAKSMSTSTVSTSTVGMPSKSGAPAVAQRGGPPPVAGRPPTGGGGSNPGAGRATGVSEADFDELEQLIRKLHNDVTDLKQLM